MSAPSPHRERLPAVYRTLDRLRYSNAQPSLSLSWDAKEARAELDSLFEQFETYQELVEDARAMTQVGHGFELDVPVNLGSFKWVESAYHILEALASTAPNPASRQEDSDG